MAAVKNEKWQKKKSGGNMVGLSYFWWRGRGCGGERENLVGEQLDYLLECTDLKGACLKPGSSAQVLTFS